MAEEKAVRVWADGCFDMMHYGHANVLRQAKALGDVLVVGVHCDADINRHKGPPVMTEQERYIMVRGCRWVDELVQASPYIPQVSTLKKHGAAFCVHGSDTTTDEEGLDCYRDIIRGGYYRVVPRTKGVSTTDLVARMLLMTNDHLSSATKQKAKKLATKSSNEVGFHCSQMKRLSSLEPRDVEGGTPQEQLLLSFAANCRKPKPNDVKVYINGSFDLFHTGHVEALQQAKAMGSHLIVGVFGDDVIHRMKGRNFPLMVMAERVLSVLQCKYVDEVVMNVPWFVTEEVIDSLGVDIVVSGTVHDFPNQHDRVYSAAVKRGIYRTFESRSSLTSLGIMKRIIAHRLKFEERNRNRKSDM